MPSTVSVRLLSPPEGMPGSTAAAISGTVAPSLGSYWADPQPNGSVQVDATTAAEAIGTAFVGDISVTFAGQTHVSEVSPYTVGQTAESQLPFVAVPVGGDVYELRLEDLTLFAMPADNDYNDRVWVFELVVLAGGPLLAPPLAAPVPVPPGTGEITFEKARSDASIQNPNQPAPKVLDQLRVSKWQDAYELLPGTTPNAKPSERDIRAKPLDQWVYGDPDSIRVRYKEPAGSVNDPNAKDIRVLKLWTTRENTTIEPERDMTFEETSVSSGVFRSKPIILVADDVDDTWDFTGQNNQCVIVADNDTDDQTVQVQLGDVVRLKRVGDATAQIAVPARYEISVRIYSLAAGPDPNNGIQGPPPTPIVTDEGVQRQMDWLEAIYAQVGVKVNLVKSNKFAPTWVEGGAVKTFEPMVEFDIAITDTQDPQFPLQKGLVKTYRDADPVRAPRYIHVYYMDRLKPVVTPIGEARPSAAAYSRTRPVAMRGNDVDFDNTIVAGKDHVDGRPVGTGERPAIEMTVSTLAHEVGHILGLLHPAIKKTTDPTASEQEVIAGLTNVMTSTDGGDTRWVAPHVGVVSTKRFAHEQEEGGIKFGLTNKGFRSQDNLKAGIIKKKD